MTPNRRVQSSVRLACAALCAALLAACGGSGGSSGNGNESINVGVTNTNSSLQAFVADKEGFFKAHGLNAKLTVLSEKQRSNTPAALGRQIDFGLTYAPIVIQAASSKIDVTAVAGANEDSPTHPLVQVVVRPGSNINGPADLAGKHVGGPTINGIIHLQLLAWVKQHGGDPKSVQGLQVPIASMVDQLRAGRIDAAEPSSPFAENIVSQGFKSIGDPAEVTNYQSVGSVWAASGKWAQAHSDAVNKFKAALRDADKFIASHSETAKQIEANSSGIPLKTLANSPPPSYRTDITAQRDITPFVGMMETVGWLKPGAGNASTLVFQPKSQ